MMRKLIMAAVMAGVAGCAQAAPEPAVKDALIETLLTPASLERSLSLSQLIVGEFEDQRQSFHVEVEVTPTRIVVVGLTPVGVPIFTLEQEAGEVSVETLGAEQFPFDPRHMLSDIQIAHWPEAALRNKFRDFGLAVREAPTENLREVLGEDGMVLVAVTYLADGDMVIEHFDRPYRLHIKSLKSKDNQ